MAELERTDDVPVLNVNDHDGVRYMVSRMLERAGFAVEEATTGAEALRKVRELRPSLVVLDIKLPDISGLEVCRSIKADPRLQSTKVLHTSAVFVAPEGKVQSLNSGADGYLSHPFEQEELIATARSLLRLVHTERQLRDAVEELQGANRGIHEFLAMLAHELRNPLSAISTSLPLLELAPPRDERETLARNVIRRQTHHLRRMVDDLLDAARVTQGKIEPRWEPVDLAGLLRRVEEHARRAHLEARRQTLTSCLPEGPVVVRGDALRLEQVFNNLLDNASKYTDAGGSVTLTLDAHPEASLVRVSVRDTGVGISPEDLPNIFKLFSQVHVPLARSRGGLGIGLTLVRTLVELHGGRVEARSEGPGRGSEMIVELPLQADAVVLQAETSSDAPPRAAQRRRVLVVEDNRDAQHTLKLLLESWGHEVVVASDGEEGIEAFGAFRPDVALVDIGLPVADGYEFARRVREHAQRAGALVVALSGYGSKEQRERASASGFDLHLVKPVEPGRLATLIERGPPTG